MDNHWFQEDIVKELLSEVLEEAVVNLLEEVITEDDQGNDYVTEEAKQIRLAVARQVGVEILCEVLSEEYAAAAASCFDDIIATHRTDLDVIWRMNDLLQCVTKEMIEEIVLDTVEQKVTSTECEGVADSVIAEVVAEECNFVSAKIFNHYHTRVALSQYRQMQTSASGVVLDTCILDSLLSQFSEASHNIHFNGRRFALQPQEGDSILSNALLEVLLSQSLALHECFPKNLPTKVIKEASQIPAVECIPLNWYKNKLTSSIAEDVVVTMLCNRLDESMHFAAEEQMKNEAVSLVTEYFSK